MYKIKPRKYHTVRIPKITKRLTSTLPSYTPCFLPTKYCTPNYSMHHVPIPVKYYKFNLMCNNIVSTARTKFGLINQF